MRSWVARQLDAPPSLGRLLCIALLARLPAVLWSRGYEFLDAHFQCIEPAYSLLEHGSGAGLSWEWVSGIRSWIYPMLLSRTFVAADLIGLDDPDGRLLVARAAHALGSLLPLWALHRLLTSRCVAPPRAARILWLWAFSGFAVYQGVAPNSTSFAANLVLFACLALPIGGARWATRAGLAIGLAFCCRFQDGLFGPGLLLGSLIARRWRDGFAFATAALLMVAVQGVSDLVAWGMFLHAPIRYVQFNLWGATLWGRESWLVYPGVLLATAPLLHRGLGFVARGGRWLPGVTAALLLFLALHQLSAHRHVRFVTSALWVWMVLWSLGAFGVEGRPLPAGRLARISVTLGVAVHLLGWFPASFLYLQREACETAAVFRERADVGGIALVGINPTGLASPFHSAGPLAMTRVEPPQLAGWLEASGDRVTHVVAREGWELPLPTGWRLEVETVVSPQWTFRKNRGVRVLRVVRG